MSAHHLKISPDKTELLFLPGKRSPTHDLSIIFDKIGYITATTCSCRYMLHNIRRIRSLLTQKAVQVLVQALVISRLDYCKSLLAGLPASAIRPLQLIQNAAARLVFNLRRFSHTTPPTLLLRSLPWLPLAARIHLKTLNEM